MPIRASRALADTSALASGNATGNKLDFEIPNRRESTSIPKASGNSQNVVNPNDMTTASIARAADDPTSAARYVPGNRAKNDPSAGATTAKGASVSTR